MVQEIQYLLRKTTPSFCQRENPIYNHKSGLGMKKENWLWLPTVIRAKNDCAGEGQQYFTEPESEPEPVVIVCGQWLAMS
jgi:hypothetical protein